MSIPLTLGTVTFNTWEIPEKFGPLGGYQSMAMHDFPGGIRTQQIFGPFPEPVRWSGFLAGKDPVTGALPFDRAQQLDRMRVTGQTITLRYGRYSWLGAVRTFHATPGHSNLIPYEIVFEPTADTSGAATKPQGSVAPEAVLAQSMIELNSVIAGNPGELPAPPTLVTPIQTMQSVVTQSLQTAGGVIANMKATAVGAIQLAAANVIAAAAPIINAANSAVDAVDVAPALLATSSARSASLVVSLPAVGPTLAQTINPNLFSLAQQHLGDASRWNEITDANGNPLGDPQPQGQITLLIPAL